MDEQRKPLYEKLQHRAVYDKAGVLARARALFRHAGDEWFEFLQHDRRVIGVAVATAAIGVTFSGFWSGWDVTLRNVLPNVAIALIPTVMLAIGVYVWCFLKAPNELSKRRLWRDLQASNATVANLMAENDALRLSGDSDAALRTLPDRLRLLGQLIGQFSVDRDNSPLDVVAPEGATARVHGAEVWFSLEASFEAQHAALLKKDAETRALYAQHFADRVIAARDEIRRALPAADLGEYENPLTTSDMRAVARWLLDAAARLP
jgi:hypothetical protein